MRRRHQQTKCMDMRVFLIVKLRFLFDVFEKNIEKKSLKKGGNCTKNGSILWNIPLKSFRRFKGNKNFYRDLSVSIKVFQGFLRIQIC